MNHFKNMRKKLSWHLLSEMLEDSNIVVNKTFNYESLSIEENYINSKIDLETFHPNAPLDYLGYLLSKEKGNKPTTGKSGFYYNAVWILGEILDPQKPSRNHPALSKECKISGNIKDANDNDDDGFSRGPFLKIKGENKSKIAFAAICYLYRAHSLLYCRNKGERDFNASKVALNDLFQAHQLGSRLYYSLKYNHLKGNYKTQDLYFRKVKEGYSNDDSPSNSPYFIWSLLSLIELKRGIIYRQIDYLDEANKYFRHYQLRFNRLSKNPYNLTKTYINEEVDIFFLTPTLLKALYERSKVFYEKGLFIESLINLLLCLGYSARKSRSMVKKNARNKHNEILKKINTAIKFLNVCRRQPVWEINQITAIFGLAENRLPKIIAEDFIILDNLEESYLRYIPKVFSRLSLILIMFLQKRESSNNNQKVAPIDILESFCEIHKKLKNTHDGKLLAQPMVSQFCMSIIKTSTDFSINSSSDNIIQPGYIGVALTQELRSNLLSNLVNNTSVSTLDEFDFYLYVLEKVTQNLNNLVTVPRKLQSFLMREGYKVRKTFGDLSRNTVFQSLQRTFDKNINSDQIPATKNKLVILRRWQSYNPRIPRPSGDSVKGGGYFLMWNGKGVVIDPGYDFIRNFYEYGYTLNDINAVIITHSHPDHDDDLSTLTTLIVEWNEFHYSMGYNLEQQVKLDIFLNESTHMKFSAWLKSSGEGIKKVILMPIVVWNMNSIKEKNRKEDEKRISIRGGNIIISVLNEYNWELEVVPAWHDDVIGSTSAVGIKLHLFEKDCRLKLGVIGYTGDTGLYNYNLGSSPVTIQGNYKDCDVLIAHLGDIRLRELLSKFNDREFKEKFNKDNQVGSTIHQYTFKLFTNKGHINFNQIDPSVVESFYRMLINLKLVPQETLKKDIFNGKLPLTSISQIIYNYIRSINNDKNNKSMIFPENVTDFKVFVKNCIKDLSKDVYNNKDENEEYYNNSDELQEYFTVINKYFKEISKITKNEYQKHNIEENSLKVIIFAILGYIATKSLDPWNYEYHLGITGIYKLFESFVGSTSDKESRIFIVAELPEELQSYRHHIARLLNKARKDDGKVSTFTGDIGLHIGLTKEKTQKEESENKEEEMEFYPRIRCTYCNYNNESVLKNLNYHDPKMIKETPLKRLDSALIYLCTVHDHHPRSNPELVDFLSSPSLRVI